MCYLSSNCFCHCCYCSMMTSWRGHSPLLAVCDENPPLIGGFPSQNFNNVEIWFFLSWKKTRCRRLETPWCDTTAMMNSCSAPIYRWCKIVIHHFSDVTWDIVSIISLLLLLILLQISLLPLLLLSYLADACIFQFHRHQQMRSLFVLSVVEESRSQRDLAHRWKMGVNFRGINSNASFIISSSDFGKAVPLLRE